MDNLEITHDILIEGSDFEFCQQQVRQFFASTMLIRYDTLLVMEKESMNGSAQTFWARMQEGLSANKMVLRELLANLKVEGFATLDDLQSLEKGYLTKILHTIAHLQDGFIGIDSRFYNLVEDSHGVTRGLLQKIIETPDNYWILKAVGSIAAAGEDPFDALRTFERRETFAD